MSNKGTIINDIINRAIEITRRYEPNPLIREKADIFVKIHILPINELVKTTESGMEVSGNILDYVILSKDRDLGKINEYLNYHETGAISLGGLFRRRVVTEDIVKGYISMVFSLLRLFNNYLICRHVLDHLIWSYDEIMNNSSFINALKSKFNYEVEIDKTLDGLSKLLVTALLDFKYGYGEFIRVRKIRKLSYGEYVVIRHLIDNLHDNEKFILIEANEDYFYLGITS
ncbi:hypothetical protein [Vulcanisaeta thermophila]|uniref:hypothetical protein n=1 Tax=Vulcanisaeta thermophila TaxID=867917 RepID=UPI000852DF0E|nr:hypothetical protein [Vulcanisaeta thermophila]